MRIQRFLFLIFTILLTYFYCEFHNYTYKYEFNNNYMSGNGYRIDANKKIISGIDKGTTYNQLLSGINYSGEVTLIDNKKVVSGNPQLRTGYILRASIDGRAELEYKLAVKGDILGDGDVSLYGAKLAAKHIVDKRTLSDEKIAAADFNNDSKLAVNDVVKMIRYYNQNFDPSKVTVRFVVQDSNVVKGDTIIVASCYLNGGSSCQVKTPVLILNNGYTMYGWNKTSNATVQEVSEGANLTVRGNTTYYSITKKDAGLTAKFVLQDTNAGTVSASSATCYLYNGGDKCNVTAPTISAKSGYTVYGWNTNKSATTASLLGGKEVSISGQTNFYSITSNVIRITFNVGEDVEGKNIKAEKLSYNYTDKNGNTVIKAEGQSLSTTCVSYNGTGCGTDYVPTIYSLGNHISGFSQTVDGDCVAVYSAKFKTDTVLYARTGYEEGVSVPTFDISEAIVYGNIVFEFEKGLNATYAAKMKELVNQVYKDYPQMFYFNGKILYAKSTSYISHLKPTYSGIANTGGLTYTTKGFSSAYIRYAGTGYEFKTFIHETGHAINYLYNQSFGLHISKQPELVELAESYYALPAAQRPLRAYAYKNFQYHAEFVSEALTETIRHLSYERHGKYPYGTIGKLPDELKVMIAGYLTNQRNYLEEKGRIKK